MLEPPIKDNKIRKDIDSIFKKLHSEIKLLEKQLEMYKDKDITVFHSREEAEIFILNCK